MGLHTYLNQDAKTRGVDGQRPKEMLPQAKQLVLQTSDRLCKL